MANSTIIVATATFRTGGEARSFIANMRKTDFSWVSKQRHKARVRVEFDHSDGPDGRLAVGAHTARVRAVHFCNEAAKARAISAVFEEKK